jgi:hypothetical protein
MPCVAANQFGNGIVLRLSGGGGQLMAMAVDFRRNLFTPRGKYSVEFAVPGKFFQDIDGAAYDGETLVFSLYKIPDFYKALQGADTLTIKAPGMTVALNLIGLQDGFRRMDACYAPNAVAAESARAPADGAGMTPMPGETAERMGVPARPDPETAVNAVLNNVAPTPPAPEASLITAAKEAEQAAQTLAATNPMKKDNVPEGRRMAGSWTKTAQVRNGPDVLFHSGGAAPPAMNGTQAMRWRALKGTDLHDVLDSWAEGAGAKLLWMPVANFAVQRSISMTGDFTSAVQDLLEQFSAADVRPVGRLYREPGTTKLVLVVEQREEKGE